MEDEKENNIDNNKLITMNEIVTTKRENKTFFTKQSLAKRYYNIRLKMSNLEKTSLVSGVKQYKLLIDEDFPINFKKKKNNNGLIEIKKDNKTTTKDNINESSYLNYYDNNNKNERYTVFLNLKENGKEEENEERPFDLKKNSFYMSGNDNINNNKRIASIKKLIDKKLLTLQGLINNIMN